MFGKKATCPGSGCSTEMPSNRYSLVRGRPPLMRGSEEPGGSATPGARPASVMKLRPFSGRLDHLLLVDDLSEPGRLAAQQRRVGGDGDGLVRRPDVQLDVEPHRLAGRDGDARADQRTEPGQLHAHGVGARRERRHRVDAIGGGHRRLVRPVLAEVTATLAPGRAAPA